MTARAMHVLPEVVNRKKVASVRAGLPDPAVLGDASEVFKLLSNPARLALLHALSHDELTVGDLAHALGLSLSGTSHQLALLRRLKLVAARDAGRLTFYRASDEFVSHLVHDCLAFVRERLGVPRPAHHHTHLVKPRRQR